MNQEADVCIIGEGSYPYYVGGVAQWVHELISAHPELSFHVIALVPPHFNAKYAYQFPKNVIGHSVHIVQDLPEGDLSFQGSDPLWEILRTTFEGFVASPSFEEFGPIVDLFQKYRNTLGQYILCESMDAWNLLLEIYQNAAPSSPFKSYFATIYTLSRSLYSVILPELPKAKIYHALCTGYAGFFLYRAKRELGVPCIVTEQGIYTNERRIEIVMAKWIVVMSSLDLALEAQKKTLKDFWLNAFFSLAHACYISCDEVISTFDGNHAIQIEGGADPSKISTIVHGIDFNDYASVRVERQKVRCVAFVGRIVPIKDVKIFIRACRLVKDHFPDVCFFAAGSIDEDPDYYMECQELTNNLGLAEDLKFLGHINFREFLLKMDLLVLTSLSEGQPLVILEAGAAGIPAIATDVGGCRQLIYGRDDENPPLGFGGIVTPLRDPKATADAILKMLTEPEFYKQCGKVIAKRIQKYYVFEEEQERYRDIYNKYLKNPLEK